MSFSYSGGEITQTGTNTDLSGIIGLTGVTHSYNGSGIEVYTLDASTELHIDGTLTIDAEVEILICKRTPGSGNNAVSVDSGGTLNIGREFTVDGFLRRSKGIGIIFDISSGSSAFATNFNYATLLVKSGGTLVWHGGTIYSAGVFYFESGSDVTIDSADDCVLSSRGETSGGSQPQFRAADGTLDINGITMIGWTTTVLTNYDNFKGINPVHANQAMSFSSATDSNVFILFENATYGQGNDLDIGFWANKWLRALNAKDGSDAYSAAHFPSPTNQANHKGLHEFRGGLTVTVADADRVPLVGARVFLRDYNWNKRLAASVVGTNPDYLADRVYDAVTDSSGEWAFITATTAIAIAAHWRSTGGVRDDGNRSYDKRGKTGDEQDLFDYGVVAYGYLPRSASSILKGLDGVMSTVSLLGDSSVSELVKATVDAYTHASDLERFYDLAASWLVADSDNIELVGKGNRLAVGAGSTIDLIDKDLYLDSAASGALTVSSTPDTNLALVGSWAVNTGEADFALTEQVGANRALVVVISSENATTARNVTDVTYGGVMLTRVATVEAGDESSTAEVTLSVWVLSELGLRSIAASPQVAVAWDTTPTSWNVATSFYENVCQTEIFTPAYTEANDEIAETVFDVDVRNWDEGIAVMCVAGDDTGATTFTGSLTEVIDNTTNAHALAIGVKKDSAITTSPDYSVVSTSTTHRCMLSFSLRPHTGAVTLGYNAQTPTLAVTSKLNTIKTTGEVHTDGVTIDGVTIDGDLYVDSDEDLTGVTVSGDLRVNVGADSTPTYSNVIVLGNVYNDDASSTLTISSVDGSTLTAGDAGTGNGQTTIDTPVTLTLTGIPAGSEIRIYDDEVAGISYGTELDGVESFVGGNFVYTHNGVANDVVVQVMKTGFVEFDITIPLDGNNATQNISLKVEENL